MPITRKQFDLGIDQTIEEWMKKIHAFLVAHKTEAYTSDEIAKELGVLLREGKSDVELILSERRTEEGERRLQELNRFDTALGKLVETVHVGERILGKEHYYCALEDKLDL